MHTNALSSFLLLSHSGQCRSTPSLHFDARDSDHLSRIPRRQGGAAHPHDGTDKGDVCDGRVGQATGREECDQREGVCVRHVVEDYQCTARLRCCDILLAWPRASFLAARGLQDMLQAREKGGVQLKITRHLQNSFEARRSEERGSARVAVHSLKSAPHPFVSALVRLQCMGHGG